MRRRGGGRTGGEGFNGSPGCDVGGRGFVLRRGRAGDHDGRDPIGRQGGRRAGRGSPEDRSGRLGCGHQRIRRRGRAGDYHQERSARRYRRQWWGAYADDQQWLMAQAAGAIAAIPGEKVILTRRRAIQAEGDQATVVHPFFQDNQLPGAESENVGLVFVQVAVLQSRGNSLINSGVVDVLESVGRPVGVHFQAEQLQFPTAAGAQALSAQAGHLESGKVDGGAGGDDRR